MARARYPGTAREVWVFAVVLDKNADHSGLETVAKRQPRRQRRSQASSKLGRPSCRVYYSDSVARGGGLGVARGRSYDQDCSSSFLRLAAPSWYGSALPHSARQRVRDALACARRKKISERRRAIVRTPCSSGRSTDACTRALSHLAIDTVLTCS